MKGRVGKGRRRWWTIPSRAESPYRPCRQPNLRSERLHKTHPDYAALNPIAREVSSRLGRRGAKRTFAECVLHAVDFVLDASATGRTEIDELDRVEKTFIGLKVEHFIRDMLDVSPGARDLRIGDTDVDIKNTIRRSRAWMIPYETYSRDEPVLLIASDAKARRSSMGLMIARPEYLGAPNRDQKRPVLAASQAHILWIVQDMPWPASRWEGIDMVRFRELRAMIEKGEDRAAAFFREHLERPTHRSVVMALLHDQYDPMKRLRGNGGARDQLSADGIALLSNRYGGKLVKELGRSIDKDEFIAIVARNPDEAEALRSAGKIV
ncbi:NaeI family type II restriction endonuclease [Caulobacter segnis]